jgi:DNA-binding SARP family transcriptional activator
VWFGILGPLEVRDGEDTLWVSSVRQRTVLAALLGRPGHVLSIAALAEAVWNDNPPATATETLRSHVMGLRRILGPRGGQRVRARYPGYLIDVGEHELDASVFTAAVRRAAAAERAEHWADCVRELTAALALWRGLPLSDVPESALLDETALALRELHRQALRMRFSAQLHLGQHREIVGELMALVRQDRGQEEFTAQLMLALYRADRQAEALAAFARTRDFLAGEYGIDPGAQLQRLYEQILRKDRDRMLLGAAG